MQLSSNNVDRHLFKLQCRQPATNLNYSHQGRGHLCAFSAIRSTLGLWLAATNSLHATQDEVTIPGVFFTGRCSNRGLGDFRRMDFKKVLADCTTGKHGISPVKSLKRRERIFALANAAYFWPWARSICTVSNTAPYDVTTASTPGGRFPVCPLSRSRIGS